MANWQLVTKPNSDCRKNFDSKTVIFCILPSIYFDHNLSLFSLSLVILILKRSRMAKFEKQICVKDGKSEKHIIP